ncbi:NAD(P)-dependent dehydrogenase (short-subunit alcohol dehydrogenase family) [Arthrobacter sp. AG1021]|uniref:SDR family NAD(P)-dependent oxidoreductase n=1 Tax=Arthrobacter sp. AG1021 TaxID=2183908 RepID=UPI000EAE82E9|nr:SDR family NAD(P)-dependent oxidoreductase [Arthrobacter sp. AG1021]RKS22846.1 NAD(P)-dependent dehydrogenase (short-subunit alcohol dehydrogenase family) [Arthrobacter sp. AG1021]
MTQKTRRVAVVTGASRGAGKGIALALGEAGTKVYVTGRTTTEGEAPLPGTVFATAGEITARGGIGVPVVLDHTDDTQVKALFERIAAEDGAIDILVNNAYAVPAELTLSGAFWEKSLDLLEVFNVGLRSSYVASYYAAPLLIAGGGLVVNTSSFGGTCYMHGPAYGAGKAAVDKMASDMAVDFKPHGVAVISLWMGMLKTERTLAELAKSPEQYGDLEATAESPEFPGRVIDALHRDPQLMQRSGQVLIAAEVAAELGVQDVNGAQPVSHRPMLGNPPVFSDAVIG